MRTWARIPTSPTNPTNRRLVDQRHEDVPAGRLLTVGLLIAPALALVNALILAADISPTSDSTQGFVVGHAIANGNFLLTGWHFPIDNFYFTDSLPYAVAEKLVGPYPRLLTIVPALVYAVFVFLACSVALKKRQSF